MFSDILSYIYLGIVVLFFPLFILLALFWLIVVANRLNHYYRSYSRLVSYNPSVMDINVFNYKIKYTVYTFLLLLIISELVGSVSYCVFIIFYRIQHAFGLESHTFNISLNCTDSYLGLWEIEVANPFISLLLGIRNATLFYTCLLLIGLLKFIFLAYQRKPNFSFVKSHLLKCVCIFPIILIPHISPQTHTISIITTPVCAIVVLYFLSKNKKLYFLILKWRCDDAFILRDNTGYLYHSRIKRNATISLNFLYYSFAIFFFSLTFSRVYSLLSILLTEKSLYFSRLYNLEIDFVFIDCHYQMIIYQIRIILDSIVPVITLIGLFLYSIPFFTVSFALVRARAFSNYF